ncbi:hypothetical protein ACFYZ8_34305 [Streptomyces sp. NPDC001668]|uniref:hypothetical protein n=1 Tax=Streptomyces sp. NPDC001668 TaxID=3364598 RepID=UPI0036C95320
MKSQFIVTLDYSPDNLVKTGLLSEADARSADRSSKAHEALMELLADAVVNQHEIAHGDIGVSHSSHLLEEDTD